MLEKLNALDHRWFISLNGNSPETLDGFMRLMSATWIWFPVVGLIIFLLIKRDRKSGLLLTGMLLLTLLLTEQMSLQLFKDVIQRLRPCYDPSLEGQVRLVADRCGGSFGFVSTHATNAFGIISFAALALRKNWFTWAGFLWAAVVSYSRIHLGVHFPGDIICGALLGLITGFLIFVLSKKLLKSTVFHEQTS